MTKNKGAQPKNKNAQKGETNKDVFLHLRCTSAQKEKLVKAASANGESLTSWALNLLLKASDDYQP